VNDRPVRATAFMFALVVAVASPELVAAQAGRSRVEEGNRLYQEGRYAEAHQMYLEAMAEAPESPLIPFNDGNALYQESDFQRAMEGYQRAIEAGDPELASAAWYNLGNALYRQQQLEPALEAYKQSLRLNPADTDAKHNLERVLEQMQQQDQQNQDGDSDQEQESDDQQDQQQDQNQQSGDQDQEGDPQENDGQNDEQPQDQPEDGQNEEQPDDQSGQQPPSAGEAEAQPQPGEMTREEAERLLDAIDENPEDVNRKPVSARGRKPRKPW
jgi:Ca-activated chloride channel homolog